MYSLIFNRLPCKSIRGPTRCHAQVWSNLKIKPISNPQTVTVFMIVIKHSSNFNFVFTFCLFFCMYTAPAPNSNNNKLTEYKCSVWIIVFYWWWRWLHYHILALIHPLVLYGLYQLLMVSIPNWQFAQG